MNEKQTCVSVGETCQREKENNQPTRARIEGGKDEKCKRKKMAEGDTFGGWTLLKISEPYISPSGKKHHRWLCECECGTKKIVSAGDISRGGSMSCGCRRRVLISRRSTKHGMSHNEKYKDLYRLWVGMRERCNSPKSSSYKNYGGRGIAVCQRWDDFETFMNDVGPKPSPKHSIDRIDVNGDYCPDNCRWATTKEQANNVRRNRRIEHQGCIRNLCQWAELFGLKPAVLGKRLKLGWDMSRALLSPVKQNKKAT